MSLIALSYQGEVEKYGAYVGIAAFFGLAVLSLLYFSQARELKRLREWAGRAPERAQELEQRAVDRAATSAAQRKPGVEPGAMAPPRRLAEMPIPAPAAQADTSGQATELADAVEEQPATNGNVPGPPTSAEPVGANGTSPPAEAGEAAAEESDDEQRVAAAGAAAGVVAGGGAAAGARTGGDVAPGDAARAAPDAAEPAASDVTARAASDVAEAPATESPVQPAPRPAGAPAGPAASPAGPATAGPAASPAGAPAVPAPRSPAEPPAAAPAPGGPAGQPADAPAGPMSAAAPGSAQAPAERPAPDAPAPGGGEPPEAEEDDRVRPGEVPAVPRATPVQRAGGTPQPAAAPLRQSRPSATPARGGRRRPGAPRRGTPREGRSAGTIALFVGLAVLILGGGTFVVSQLGEDDSPPAPNRSAPPPGATATADGANASGTSPAETNVAVLNGTTFTGLAGQLADRVAREGGYQRGATETNTRDQTIQTSTVFYGDGFRSQARSVARLLSISAIEPLDADTQALAPDADVLVLAGADQAP